MRRSLSLLPFALLLAAVVSCGRIQIPQCILDGSCLPRLATPTATATEPPRPVPRETIAPTAAVTATSTATATAGQPLSSPTAVPVPPLKPPTADFVNGGACNYHSSHGEFTGQCEFNIWNKISIPDPANFTPPCDPNQCPQVWRPSGMALACDHMFTPAGAPAGVVDPKTQQWVSILWYVCSGTDWHILGDFAIEAAAGSRLCAPSEQPGACIKWEPRAFRPADGYNGRMSGSGSYYVRLPWDAVYCKSPTDPDPTCPSGKLPVPGAGVANGPFTIPPH